MTTTAATTTDLFERVRELRPIIEAHRAEAERLRHLPDAVAEAFVERNLYRTLLPRDLGGEDIDPVTFIELVEEVAYYDGSAGWNFAIASGSNIFAGWFPPNVAQDVYGTPESCVAGAAAPLGRALVVDGGYRVSGRWGWASGIHQATHVMAGCIVFDADTPRRNEAGIPVFRHIVVPRSSCTVLDTWLVGGMSGTGSTEFEINDEFVPHERLFEMFPAEVHHNAPIFRVPSTFFGVALAAVALGTSRAAIEGLIELAVGKLTLMTRTKVKDHPAFQYDVAKAQALRESGFEYLRSSTALLWDIVLSGRQITMEERARVRRATVHAAESAAQVVDICYRAAGGTALFEHSAFAPSMRDVHAALGHIVLSRATMEDAGRVTLGLDPLSPIF